MDCDGPDTVLETDQPEYAVGDPIQLTWQDAPGWPLDVITVAAAGSPDDEYFGFDYTDRSFSGPYDGELEVTELTYLGADELPAGDWEVRLFANNDLDALQARVAFTVR